MEVNYLFCSIIPHWKWQLITRSKQNAPRCSRYSKNFSYERKSSLPAARNLIHGTAEHSPCKVFSLRYLKGDDIWVWSDIVVHWLQQFPDTSWRHGEWNICLCPAPHLHEFVFSKPNHQHLPRFEGKKVVRVLIDGIHDSLQASWRILCTQHFDMNPQPLTIGSIKYLRLIATI